MPSGKSSAKIKIAERSASKRTSGGGVDPGPGDPAAEPSTIPEPVDIPPPPTSSELVVKGSSDKASTSASGSTPKSGHSKPKSASSTPVAGAPSAIGSMSSKQASKSTTKTGGTSAPAETSGANAEPTEPQETPEQTDGEATPPNENTEGEDGTTSPMDETAAPGEGASETPVSDKKSSKKSTQKTLKSTMKSTTKSSKKLSTTGAGAEPDTDKPETGLGSKGAVSEGYGVSSKMGKSGTKSTTKPNASASPEGADESMSPSESPTTGTEGETTPASPSRAKPNTPGKKGKKKKVTRFRYHKRITVRTTGKSHPSSIISKVNRKEGPITPSTIDDLDPQQLLKKAGIKGSKKAHWRVRMRQTKRVTKGGKTTAQTKVAYRDSEGKKRIKTSDTPNCKNCGKQLEDCTCED